MTTLSNFSIGSQFAADAAFKARRTMTGAIARYQRVKELFTEMILLVLPSVTL